MSTGKRQLPSDVSRCLDSGCPHRMGCLRFLQHETGRVMVDTFRVDGECDYKIPAYPEKVKTKMNDGPYDAIIKERQGKGGMLIRKHTAANAACCSRIISQLESAEMLEERDWAVWMLWHRTLDWQSQEAVQQLHAEQMEELQQTVDELRRNLAESETK